MTSKNLLNVLITTALFGTLISAVSAESPNSKQVSVDQPKGVYRIINAGRADCPKATAEFEQKLHKYEAWHFCFSYKFQRKADPFSDLTNMVYDVVNIGLPFTKSVDLYQPTNDSIRFEVPEGGNYRLYEYFDHAGSVPPPGKYTDYKWKNKTDTSIDWWWKLRQRGTGKNARVYGVIQVTFVPDHLYDKAKADGFSMK